MEADGSLRDGAAVAVFGKDWWEAPHRQMGRHQQERDDMPQLQLHFLAHEVRRAYAVTLFAAVPRSEALAMEERKVYLLADVMDRELFVKLTEEMRLPGQCGVGASSGALRHS